jgi:hypothetical protein
VSEHQFRFDDGAAYRRRRSRRTRTSICSGSSLSRGRLRASYDASPISAAVHLDHGSKHCGHARVGKGAGRLTLTLQSALVRDVVLPNLAISVRSCIRWSLRRDFPAARCLLTCRRHAGGIDGAQSMAWPLFRARRVALDLYVPGHRSNTLSSIRQAAVSA